MRAYSSLAGDVRFLPAFGYGSSSTCWTPFFLHLDGSLSLERTNESEAFLSYQFDARHRVPSDGVGVDSWGTPRTRKSRESCSIYAPLPEVLVFETSPLTQDVEVAGPIEAVLWISSDSFDADFNFRLIDVYPPNRDDPQGFALNLIEDMFQRRYADLQENPSSLQLNEIYRIRAESLPIIHLFDRGHRIRIAIFNSCFSRSGTDWHCQPAGGVAHGGAALANRLYLDNERGSHLVLPLVAHREN